MNFDCPGCHAKYQIADEKVASKAVKMKCRKCQTPILISSLGARRALGASEGRAITMPPGMSVAPAAPARSLGPPSMPRRRSLGPGSLGSGSEAAVQTAPSSEAPPPPGILEAAGAAASLDALVPPPRKSGGPGPLHSPPHSTLHKASLPPSRAALGSIADGVPVNGAHVEAPVASASSASGLSKPPEGPLSRGPAIGAHLGNLNIKIRDNDQAGPPSLRRMASKIPMETWHVGMAGTVQGPWTRTEIAERCKKGEIDAEALVWKDGMSGWAPIGSVDALKELVAPAPEAPVPADVVANMPQTFAEAPAAPSDLGSTFSPVIGSEVGPKIKSRDSLWARVEAKAPKRSHIAFLALAAAVFGGAMTFAFFGGSETKVVEKVVEVHVQDKVRPADNVPPPPPASDTPGEVAARPSTTGKATASRPTAGDAAASPGASGTDAKGGLKGLSGLSGLSSAGPQTGPTSGATSAATQALDASQVQSTVSRYQSGVKRGCWQPALDSRDKSAPSSARVTVTITVASSGAVKNVSSSGDPPGYRGLASCIQSRVSAWSFPASTGSTTVNVPFVFAAQ